jgi:hypothetical protein
MKEKKMGQDHSRFPYYITLRQGTPFKYMRLTLFQGPIKFCFGLETATSAELEIGGNFRVCSAFRMLNAALLKLFVHPACRTQVLTTALERSLALKAISELIQEIPVHM